MGAKVTSVSRDQRVEGGGRWSLALAKNDSTKYSSDWRHDLRCIRSISLSSLSWLLPGEVSSKKTSTHFFGIHSIPFDLCLPNDYSLIREQLLRYQVQRQMLGWIAEGPDHLLKIIIAYFHIQTARWRLSLLWYYTLYCILIYWYSDHSLKIIIAILLYTLYCRLTY